MSIIASHSPLNISETVRDRGLVSKDHQQEMAHDDGHSSAVANSQWLVIAPGISYQLMMMMKSGEPLASLQH